ncbi:MAG: AAA domain-containing protein, partial [Balneolaceae bacterium]
MRSFSPSSTSKGTGKTKTIVELIRSILKCTNHHIIVLSERNGAIDAIAEKISEDCIDHKPGKPTKDAKVRDVELWSSVVAFG